jgi:hypothetical protein
MDRGSLACVSVMLPNAALATLVFGAPHCTTLVALIRRRVRRRHVLQQVQRHGVHPAARNHVPRKRLRHAVDGVQRVVDRGPGLREITGSLALGRGALPGAHRNARLQPFVRIEEERAVLLHGPADRAAGIVVKDLLLGDPAHDVLVEVRVQRRVAVDVIPGPVELVGTAADRNRNRAAAGSPELGVIGTRGDPHFLHRVG